MRADDGCVIPTLIAQALGGQPLTVYGQGTQTRSFCYVGDLIEGLLRLLLAEEAAGDWALPVNLGNPEEITILQLAERLRALMRADAPIRFAPLPTDDPRRRRPDISRARALLAWTPRVALDDGLRHTVAHFRGLAAAA